MRISVVIPYRDAAATLDEALASVRAQRGVEVEIVAVDDGSRDGGAAIAARHGAVHVEGGGRGLVAALRAGLARATGDRIARMDADDVCLPDRLARQAALLASDPSLGAVGTRVEAFPDRAVAGGMRRYVAWQNTLVTPADHRRELFVESPLCHPSVMLRRDALETVGGWRDVPGPEDYDLWLRLDAAGYGLAKVPAVLLRWRHRAGRATFADPRYAKQRFTEAKAPHLARTLRATGKPLAVWGAGRTGKRLARALEPHGIRPELFVDIAPAKIGREARGRPIAGADAIAGGGYTVVGAVSALGGRDQIRHAVTAMGYVEGRDLWLAA